jgi:hypothetical protein
MSLPLSGCVDFHEVAVSIIARNVTQKLVDAFLPLELIEIVIF